jgi:hypothetical protein
MMTNEQIVDRMHEALGHLYQVDNDEKEELVTFSSTLLEGGENLNIPSDELEKMDPSKLSGLIGDFLVWGITGKLKDAIIALHEEECREAETHAADSELFNF